MLGAVLMLLPGYVTDFIGLLCFIPVLRVLIGQSLLSWLGESVYSSSRFTGFYTKFDPTDGFSPNDHKPTKPKKSSNYFHQQPLEGDVIEGQYESNEVSEK